MSSPQSSKSKLPPELFAALPEALQKFLSAGKRQVETDTDDWTVEIKIPPGYLAKALPAGTVLIGNNGVGDHLFLAPETANPAAFSHKVHLYLHEGPEIVVLAEDLNLLLNPPPAAVTQRPTVLYADGQTAVQLGDEVTARSFFVRRPARVIYVPGVSKKNREMEHHGLCWVCLESASGGRIGTVVDPETSRLGKSVRFVKRSAEPFKEMSPDERFE